MVPPNSMTFWLNVRKAAEFPLFFMLVWMCAFAASLLNIAGTRFNCRDWAISDRA